jgi:hypothetical protein
MRKKKMSLRSFTPYEDLRSGFAKMAADAGLPSL